MDGMRLSLQALAVRLTQDLSSGRQREAMVFAPTAASVGDLVAACPDLAELLATPLDRFMREGQLLELRVPWHTETLWFVPDESDAGALGREGVGRARVWTAAELGTLMTLSRRTPAIVKGVALAKLAIGGDLVEVRPRAVSGVASWGVSAQRPERDGPDRCHRVVRPHAPKARIVGTRRIVPRVPPQEVTRDKTPDSMSHLQ